MNFRNLVGALAAVAVAGVALSAPAKADNLVKFASINSILNQQVFTYAENGSFNVIDIIPGAGTGNYNFFGLQNDTLRFDVPVLVQFTGLGDDGDLVAPSDPSGDYTQNLTGGTFTVTNYFTNELLLTGNFGSAVLSGQPGSAGGSLKTTFNDVAYTGGVYYTSDPNLLSSPPGVMSIALNTINNGAGLALNAGGTSFRSFTASGDINFSATSVVPEPGEYAVMGLMGLTMGGLVVRGRFKKSA